MRGKGGRVLPGAVVVAVIGLVAGGCSATPVGPQVPSGPGPGSTPSRSLPATPASTQRWQSGRALALPCPQDGPVSSGTLLHDGPLKASLRGYTEPEIVLHPGGRIDLRDGVLGVAGGDYVSAADNASSPEETTYTNVPKGIGVVTIARFQDAAKDAASHADDFAAAEVRLSDTRPVRWKERGYAGTDIATAAWFGKAARERFAATGYGPFSVDDEGRMEAVVTGGWGAPCHFFDVAPRKTDEVHDVVLITTEGDGGFTQYVGYDAAGHAAAAVLLGYVPWSGLGLPGTPPPGVR